MAETLLTDPKRLDVLKHLVRTLSLETYKALANAFAHDAANDISVSPKLLELFDEILEVSQAG